MKLVVQREPDMTECVPGRLYIDNQYECYTLEWLRSGDHPCIPVGVYDLILIPSPHLRYVTPEVLNVPERTAIRIHVANRASELLGCTAVGENRANNVVGNSKIAFEKLMTLLKTTNDPMTIEYKDPK